MKVKCIDNGRLIFQGMQITAASELVIGQEYDVVSSDDDNYRLKVGSGRIFGFLKIRFQVVDDATPTPALAGEASCPGCGKMNDIGVGKCWWCEGKL